MLAVSLGTVHHKRLTKVTCVPRRTGAPAKQSHSHTSHDLCDRNGSARSTEDVAEELNLPKSELHGCVKGVPVVDTPVPVATPPDRPCAPGWLAAGPPPARPCAPSPTGAQTGSAPDWNTWHDHVNRQASSGSTPGQTNASGPYMHPPHKSRKAGSSLLLITTDDAAMESCSCTGDCEPP